MPKIIKENGYWAGKALKKGSEYMAVGCAYVELPDSSVIKPSRNELVLDIQEFLHVEIGVYCKIEIIRVIARELCNERIGTRYCIDTFSQYGVRKIIQ
jgi:hypothetical protein